MNREEYIKIYEKYLDGKCSDEELAFLESYEDSFVIDTLYYWDTERMGDEKTFKKNILSNVRLRIGRARAGELIWKKYISIAAMLTILCSISFFLYVDYKKSDTEIKAIKTQNKLAENPNALPILTLDDGEKVALLDSSINVVYSEKGGSITRKNKEIIYTETSTTDKTIRYNTLEIPKGMSYKITLSDGSAVWLNAGSVLKFPVSFAGTERKVELSGEAYFDISKNKQKPFKVIANKSEIEVLGTQFNVNAYHKEQTHTTLIEGVVKLKAAKSEAVLRPGQVGTDTKSGLIELKKANIESVIDWKEGLFIFDDENLETILKKVSRWYDVDIHYAGEISDYLYYGRLERTVKLEELLKSIELTGKVKFKIEGRKIIVITYK